MMKPVKVVVLLLVFGLVSVTVYWFAPYKIEGNGYYHKIWAHRANSIEKANSALDYFKGIELDLIYLEGTNVLDVNHPPAESINLNFEHYLNHINLKESPFLWLDIKNLDKENAFAILTKLKELCEKHQIKFDKILVESPTREALPIFNREGFLTSYYLPYGLSLRKPKDLEKTLTDIKRFIAYQPDLMLSSSYKDYDIVKEHFPKRYKCFWAIERPINKNYREIRAVLKDSMVKVVLFHYTTFVPNR